MYRYFFSVSVIVLLLSSNVKGQSDDRKLTSVNPVTMGYSANFFQKIGKEASDSIPSLGSMLVWQKKGIVYEGYFNGASSATTFNIKSATKSIVSALAGIANDKGMLPDLNTPVLKVLTEYSKPINSSPNVWLANMRIGNDSIRRTMTLKHLLSMQAGFQWIENGPVSRVFCLSSDPVRFALDLPYDDYPGQIFNYNSAAASIFCAALSKGIKEDLNKFAQDNLFEPSGIKLSSWAVDPLGRYIGGSEMCMTPQDLMRFGLLYLHNGKVNGKQLISESWIKESTDKHVELDQWDYCE